MSKNKKSNMPKEPFNTREAFVRYAKRYGTILLISLPIILIINYVLGLNLSWYNGAVSFFASFAMLLLACFIGLIIYTKKDDKKRAKEEVEGKESDPFAD